MICVPMGTMAAGGDGGGVVLEDDMILMMMVILGQLYDHHRPWSGSLIASCMLMLFVEAKDTDRKGGKAPLEISRCFPP